MNTMTTVSFLPQVLCPLPSPSPSVALPSSASSVTTADDISITSSQILSDQPRTLSPPESLVATEYPTEASSTDDSAPLRRDSPKKKKSVIGGARVSSSTVVAKDNHRTPKGTFSRKDRPQVARKRTATEEDDNDSKNNQVFSPSKKRAKVVGLKNLGNTCYNNAVIQALSHTSPLRDFFLARRFPASVDSEEIAKRDDLATHMHMIMTRPRTRGAARLEEQIVIPTNVNLCDEFSRLLRLLWNVPAAPEAPKGSRYSCARQSTGSNAVSPHEFASAVAAVLPLFYRRHEQQDAQEFLRCALERIQDELASEMLDTSEGSIDGPTATQDTIVQAVFGGVLWNKIVCLSCDGFTIKPDPFLDLSLVIPEHPGSPSKASCLQDPVTLEDCLDLFSSAEELEGSPSPPASASSSTSGSGRSCMSCGSDNGFSKALEFGELPQVLCIHLKRFRWRGAGRGGRQKVDTHVKFPMEGLDMERWIGGGMSGPVLYDLYAVVVHQGSGASSGHYYAYTKHQGEWYCLNDDRTSKVTAETVAKAKAYLLFYKRRA